MTQEEDPWAVPEGSQEAAQYEQGVDEAQYDQGTTEAGCGYWYWGYQFRRAGAWENWCWDPQWGWWYAESEDGKSKFVRLT